MLVEARELKTLMREITQEFVARYSYPVIFTQNALAGENTTLRRVLLRGGDGPHRVLAIVDSGVLAANPQLPEQLAQYAAQHSDVMELVAPPLVVRGGEICKTDPREVAEIYALIAHHRICRHSYVLVIGGGSVLDAAGFAAATGHRGIRVIRMPTTVLAQNDAGVGVKNGIDFQGRKNFVGTFAPPFAVIDDFEFLKTLPARHLRSGIAESVKVALIKDRELFEQLRNERLRLAAFEPEVMRKMIVRTAELHLEHIRTSGDPFELGSARPLDFGHWAAHKLEELSGFELSHGEAVAIGIALDSTYSQRSGMIGEVALHQILATLEAIGFELQHSALADLDVEGALSDFREHLGGELCITLLSEIGKGVEVGHIGVEVMVKSIDFLMSRESSRE